MNSLQKLIESFDEVTHRKIHRTPETYRAIDEWAIEEITRNVHNYHSYNGNLPYTKRLYRDGIDFPLRRYHEYCVKQRYGYHYIQKDLEENGVFEHMVPLRTIRDMILAGVLTAKQGCNMPTCRISKFNDEKLRLAGLASTTPDIFYFWKRYESCMSENFITYKEDNVNLIRNLDDHFEYFLD